MCLPSMTAWKMCFQDKSQFFFAEAGSILAVKALWEDLWDEKVGVEDLFSTLHATG